MRKISLGVMVGFLSIGAALPALAQNAAPVAAAMNSAALGHDGWRPGNDWNRDIDVRCASGGYKYNMCQVDTGRGSQVQLVQQISKTGCEEGRTWGWNRAGIWVDQGCEGVFRVSRRWQDGDSEQGNNQDGDSEQGNNDNGYEHDHHHGGGGGGDWHPGAGWDRTIRVQCASSGYTYNMCEVDTGRGGSVRVERQLSKTRCIEGQTWGFNRAGVWVDGGCEAIFRVNRRWR